jgi:hypothetical protein
MLHYEIHILTFTIAVRSEELVVTPACFLSDTTEEVLLVCFTDIIFTLFCLNYICI